MIFKATSKSTGQTTLDTNFRSLKNFFTKQNLLSDFDMAAIADYNAQLSHVPAHVAINRTMADTSKEARMIVRNAHGGAVALDTLKKSSAAATMGIQALATAANVAVSWGISMLISGLYELSRVSDTVSQKAQDIGVSFNNTKSDIEGYKERISELQNVINDNGSSVEQITNARKSLLSIQDELISKFGDEQSAITLVTDAINGQVGALDTLTQNQWQEKLNQFNDGNFINNVGNYFNGYSNNVERMIDDYGNYTAKIDTDLFEELIQKNQLQRQEFERLLITNFNASPTLGDLSGTSENLWPKFNNALENGERADE